MFAGGQRTMHTVPAQVDTEPFGTQYESLTHTFPLPQHCCATHMPADALVFFATLLNSPHSQLGIELCQQCMDRMRLACAADVSSEGIIGVTTGGRRTPPQMLAAAQHVPPVQVEPFGQQVCRRTPDTVSHSERCLLHWVADRCRPISPCCKKYNAQA